MGAESRSDFEFRESGVNFVENELIFGRMRVSLR